MTGRKCFIKRFIALGMSGALLITGMGQMRYSSYKDVKLEIASSNVDVAEVILPAGGFSVQECSLSKEQCAAMPVFGSKYSEKIAFNAPGGTIAWQQSGTATFGSSSYGYSKLTDNQKLAYETILKATAGTDYKGTESSCFMASTSLNGAEGYKVTMPTGLTMEDMRIGYSALYEDHPELYWIKSGYQYQGNQFIILVDNSYDTKAERDVIDAAIHSSTGEVEKGKAAYNKGTTAYGKVLNLYSQLLEDLTYAYTSSGGIEPAVWAHNIVGGLTEDHTDSSGKHKVVCEGYAKTFQYLLNILGVENVYVVGTGNGMGHAWNLVEIDNVWYNTDLTWDDQKDGYNFMYIGMPQSYFSQKHKPDSTSSKWWLYDLPTVDDTTDLSKTYYGRYQALATQANCTDVKAFIRAAGASSPNNDLIILADSISLINSIANELGINMYYKASEYSGYAYVFVKNGALQYKITKPATNLSISPTSYLLDTTQSKTFPINITTTTSQCNDYVNIELSDKTKVSLDSYCVPIQNGTATITVTGKRNGSVNVVATALAGSGSAICHVTVTGCSLSQNMYTDAGGTKEVSEEDLTAYVNGGKIKDTRGISRNSKQVILYTDLKIPTYTDKRGKTKTGKLVVGITSSEDVPTLVKGKIVSDSTAKNTAKAAIKIKKGASTQKITVTALKDTGEVYLWALGLGDNNAIISEDYCQITVKAAPSKITPVDQSPESASAKKYTKATAFLKDSIFVYLKGEYKDSTKTMKLAKDATYTYSAGKDSEYLLVTKFSETMYSITPQKLKNNSMTSAKVTFICNENGKKATFTLKFANPVVAANGVSQSTSSLLKKGDTCDIGISVRTAGNTSVTTDKARVVVTGVSDLAVSGDVVSKSNVYKGTLSGTTIKVTRQKEANQAAYVYVLYKDKVSGVETAYKVASISSSGSVSLN